MFIKVTDATTNTKMLLRKDTIFGIYEESRGSVNVRKILFTDNSKPYELVTETLDELYRILNN